MFSIMIKDPNLLFSIVNTALRDKYSSFDDYCLSEDLSKEDILSVLSSAGYYYDRDTNSFKQK